MKTFTKGRKSFGTYFPENNTFIKDNVYKSKHLFRVLNAWGIDSGILSKLKPDTKIIIQEQEEGITYTATTQDFDLYGKYFHFKGTSIDHDAQRFLELSRWQQTPTEKPKQLTQDQLDENEYLTNQGLSKRW